MKNLLVLGAVAVLFNFPLSAIASPVVRLIKQSLVSGESAILQTINVWNGYGVSISFYEIEETIKRVWIDDPSEILIDSDGCLQGINQNCPEVGAGLLHLRRIEKLNIRGLPKSRATHLTIITQTTEGKRKTYHFRVAPDNGNPQYSEIAIVSDPLPIDAASVRKLEPLKQTLNTTRQIRSGVSVAMRNNWLKPSDELHNRIEKMIFYLQEGDELSTAANKAVVSMELVNKLIQIGSKN